MQDVHVILDFPGLARNREQLEAAPPRRIISAYHVGAVRAAFRDAEQAARDGAWVIGFIAYEAAPAFDPALVTRSPSGEVPLLWFGVFDEPAHVQPVADMMGVRAPDVMPMEWTADPESRASYDEAIADIREAIAAGDVYQVNHTLRLRAHYDAAPATLYDALVSGRHGVYHALIETPDWAIVSASPELFIDVHGRTVTTRPMKGTARRGRWLEEDACAHEQLARSQKDRAENLMIVDLLRNDFGRIARYGSVEVSDMFAIETFPTVHQMTSTITATLRDEVTIGDIFAAAFPCGSVTGAPKIAAMQRIAALESEPRGVYCGAIGVMRPDGSATFNVAIRTVVMEKRARTAVYGTGGGITWDSAAAAEYDEARAKAALLTDPVPEFELLETMRLENGVIPRLDSHIARLTASARYWSFDDAGPAAALAALDQLAANTRTGTWRVRMIMSRSGHVSITRVEMDASPAVPRRIVVADSAVHSRDPLLFHKTTARAAYDARRAGHPDAFDVLLWNEQGCITEFTIGNVVCEIDGRLVTPPREAGLLAGTFRAELLQRDAIREMDITLDDLARVTRMWLINSVREWVPITDWTIGENRKGQRR